MRARTGGRSDTGWRGILRLMTPGTPTPAVPTALLADRIRRAGDVAAEHGVDLLLVTPGTDLRYLLDADARQPRAAHLPGAAAAGHRRRPARRAPAGGAGLAPASALDDLGVEVVTWNDGEDPYLLVSDLAGGPTRLAVADTMPAEHVLGLREALPEADADAGRAGRHRAADAQGRRRGRASCGPRARRSTGCTPGWASGSGGPHRGAGRRGHRRGDRRGGPRRGRVRHRRLRPERRQPAPRGVRPGDRDRRRRRRRHRRPAADRLLLRLHPHLRRRRASRPRGCRRRTRCCRTPRSRPSPRSGPA